VWAGILRPMIVRRLWVCVGVFASAMAIGVSSRPAAAAGSLVPAAHPACVAVAGSVGDYAIANATITDPGADGFATVHGSGADWQASSTNNFTTGASLPNLTITRIAADGKICMTSSSTTHMVLDVVGYIKASAITPVTTVGADRVLDTRSRKTCFLVENGTQYEDTDCDGIPDYRDPDSSKDRRAKAGQAVCVASGGLPGDLAIANATITDPAAGGFATVHASTADWQASSTNNFTTGASLPNLTITKIGADGKLCMTSSATTHMIIDVVGYIRASAIIPVSTPGADRVLDTRR
jgi:general stress protein 26